jgi:hypothetical protein
VQSTQPPTRHPIVNPCKGGRANWKTAKKTRKIGNSAENNRAEQGKNNKSTAWKPGPSPPAPFEIGYISLCRERRVLSRQKTRRGHPPGNLHNSELYPFLPKSRYVVKQKLPTAKTTDSKNFGQKLPTAKTTGRAKLERTKGAYY